MVSTRSALRFAKPPNSVSLLLHTTKKKDSAVTEATELSRTAAAHDKGEGFSKGLYKLLRSSYKLRYAEVNITPWIQSSRKPPNSVLLLVHTTQKKYLVVTEATELSRTAAAHDKVTRYPNTQGDGHLG